jgi:hypothetical protein
VQVSVWHWERESKRACKSARMWASGILTTCTRIGKTVRTCLNIVQTCMYMFTILHTHMNVYVHGMYMYIHLYKCTYMCMNSNIGIYIVHTCSWIHIFVCTWYIHIHRC